jgi:hypothetical protein
LRKTAQNFVLFCTELAKSVQKFCAVLRDLKRFCENAQKQRKTLNFAQFRRAMHIPACGSIEK